MSLSFSGPKGWIEQRWIVYALLRDSVQHHIEGGTPTEDFDALHSVAEALGSKRVLLNARKLHGELTRARAALAGRPMEDLAISARTRAVLRMTWPPPEQRETVLVSEWGGSIPMLGDVPRVTLDDVFGYLIDGLLRITENASEGEQIEVVDL